jgi:hypothetical protein
MNSVFSLPFDGDSNWNTGARHVKLGAEIDSNYTCKYSKIMNMATVRNCEDMPDIFNVDRICI